MYTQASISQLGQKSGQIKINYSVVQRYITKHKRKSCPTAAEATMARAKFKTETDNLIRLLSKLGKTESPVIINYDHLAESLSAYVSKLSSGIAFPNELNSLHNILNLIKEGGFTKVLGIFVIRTTNLQVRFSKLPHIKDDPANLENEQIESMRKGYLLFGKDLNDLIFNIQTIIKILNYSQKEQLIAKAVIRNDLSKAA